MVFPTGYGGWKNTSKVKRVRKPCSAGRLFAEARKRIVFLYPIKGPSMNPTMPIIQLWREAALFVCQAENLVGPSMLIKDDMEKAWVR